MTMAMRAKVKKKEIIIGFINYYISVLMTEKGFDGVSMHQPDFFYKY